MYEAHLDLTGFALGLKLQTCELVVPVQTSFGNSTPQLNDVTSSPGTSVKSVPTAFVWQLSNRSLVRGKPASLRLSIPFSEEEEEDESHDLNEYSNQKTSAKLEFTFHVMPGSPWCHLEVDADAIVIHPLSKVSFDITRTLQSGSKYFIPLIDGPTSDA